MKLIAWPFGRRGFRRRSRHTLCLILWRTILIGLKSPEEVSYGKDEDQVEEALNHKAHDEAFFSRCVFIRFRDRFYLWLIGNIGSAIWLRDCIIRACSVGCVLLLTSLIFIIRRISYCLGSRWSSCHRIITWWLYNLTRIWVCSIYIWSWSLFSWLSRRVRWLIRLWGICGVSLITRSRGRRLVCRGWRVWFRWWSRSCRLIFRGCCICSLINWVLLQISRYSLGFWFYGHRVIL